MSSTTFTIEQYSIKIQRTPSFEAWIWIRGGGNNVFVNFVSEGEPIPTNLWFPDTKFGRIYFRHTLLDSVVDMLRNEKPVKCTMNDVYSTLCYLGTTFEPPGEGE